MPLFLSSTQHPLLQTNYLQALAFLQLREGGAQLTAFSSFNTPPTLYLTPASVEPTMKRKELCTLLYSF